MLRENNFKQTITGVKIQDEEEITCDKITITLKRAAHYLSALQTIDGHWPAQTGGPLFYVPPFVICMYITGYLDSVLPKEYRKEVLHYIYCHQLLPQDKKHTASTGWEEDERVAKSESLVEMNDMDENKEEQGWLQE
ncbi:Beta-amyrin synthase [Spatholobus suberectus]|nr:Beta-amyrin synthase [Spatholobus suberectus]